MIAPARLLVVDDNPSIHEDFAKVLRPRPLANTRLDEMESELFGNVGIRVHHELPFDLDTASQGEEALARVCAALVEGRPYALAFVDMRMPPGWDGLETIRRLWRADRRLGIVICSAYSDHDWSALAREFGSNNRLLVMKKPAASEEILQCATAMVAKWQAERAVERQLADLESQVVERTSSLREALSSCEDEATRRVQAYDTRRAAWTQECQGLAATTVADSMAPPIDEVVGDLQGLNENFRQLCSTVRSLRGSGTAPAQGERADVDFLLSEVPRVMARTLDGVEHVAGLLRAMRRYRVQGAAEKTADINALVEGALAVTQAESRSVAGVALRLERLPPVRCDAGETQHAVIEMLSVAILASTVLSAPGHIIVSTSDYGGLVEISVDCDSEHLGEPGLCALARGRSLAGRQGGRLDLSMETEGMRLSLWLPVDGVDIAGVPSAQH